jgi:anthranilate/para-aminobenzoate synthase component I
LNNDPISLLVGYFGYEIIRYIEPKLAKISQPDELGMPDILRIVDNYDVAFFTGKRLNDWYFP